MLVTVALTVWLRRVGGPNVPFALPHQSRDAIRALIWVDDPENLHLRVFGHLMLPTSQDSWRPRLLLETAEPGPLIPATAETRIQVLRRVESPRIRPYSMRFDLPAGTEQTLCFKLVEESYPGHKVPLCIPMEDYSPSPAGAAGAIGLGGSSGRTLVCEALAPSHRHNASAPALWTAVGPPRHTGSTRDWRSYYGQIAVRTAHWLSYHVAMGSSGLLLYTDRLARQYLRRHAVVLPYLRSGHLRLVAWDMPERGHKSDEPYLRGAVRSKHGVRPLGYNYDQALFASHALLGLSACGTNLMLLVSDLDEFIHTPTGGQPWPAPLNTCFTRTPSRHSLRSSRGSRQAADFVATHTVQRYALVTTRMTPEREARMWVSMDPLAAARGERTRTAANGTRRRMHEQQPGGDGAGARRLQQDAVSSAAGAAGAAAGQVGDSGGSGWDKAALQTHPLALYDRRAPRAHTTLHGKMLVLPAAEVVAFFVHEGVPRRGSSELVDAECLVLLHVSNYWRPRNNGTAVRVPHGRGGKRTRASPYVPFSWDSSPLHALFAQGIAAFEAAGNATRAA